MKTLVVGVLVLAAVAGTGCQTHMVFVEQSHIGLKAEVNMQSNTPANLDIGFERGIFAMIPQRNKGDDGSITQSVDANGVTTVTLSPDKGELTSLFNKFEAHIGWNDPIYVRQIVATGVAATNVAADPTVLNSIWEEANDADK